MPRPLQVKMFMDAEPSNLEKQINTWLADIGSAAIIKTETTPVTGSASSIIVSIWYEPPEAD